MLLVRTSAVVIKIDNWRDGNLLSVGQTTAAFVSPRIPKLFVLSRFRVQIEQCAWMRNGRRIIISRLLSFFVSFKFIFLSTYYLQFFYYFFPSSCICKVWIISQSNVTDLSKHSKTKWSIFWRTRDKSIGGLIGALIVDSASCQSVLPNCQFNFPSR